MAIYKIFPTEDTTLYSAYPNMNTGLDEIVEATTNFITGALQIQGDEPQTSRFLVKFNPDDISYVSESLIGNNSWEANLRLFVANATGLQTNTVVQVNAVSQSWNMGTGRYMSNPEVTNGASWLWREYSGSAAWAITGGAWITTPSASQTFSYRSDLDLNFDVTSIVEHWTGSAPLWDNNGFIVRQSGSQEFVNNINQQITLKYFSVDTHTIYPPQLEFKWKDFSFNTGSSTQTVITGSNLYISLNDNPGYYHSESIQRFRLNVRPQYPTKTFQTSSIYTTNYYLPSGSSYYAIKDLDTNEYLVNFDPIYTLISADVSSSYFDVYMNGLEPQRYYTILIQTTVGGTTLVLDSNYNFKVING
jgi:hypothetical protein